VCAGNLTWRPLLGAGHPATWRPSLGARVKPADLLMAYTCRACNLSQGDTQLPG